MTAFTLTLDVAPRPPHHGISDDSKEKRGRKPLESSFSENFLSLFLSLSLSSLRHIRIPVVTPPSTVGLFAQIKDRRTNNNRLNRPLKTKSNY